MDDGGCSLQKRYQKAKDKSIEERKHKEAI
jgi:hypothetical protein